MPVLGSFQLSQEPIKMDYCPNVWAWRHKIELNVEHVNLIGYKARLLDWCVMFICTLKGSFFVEYSNSEFYWPYWSELTYLTPYWCMVHPWYSSDTEDCHGMCVAVVEMYLAKKVVSTYICWPLLQVLTFGWADFWSMMPALWHAKMCHDRRYQRALMPWGDSP